MSAGTGFIRRHIFHNVGLKIVAVVIAFLLWVAVASAPKSEVGFLVPVEFHNVPENLEVASEELPQAQVRVRGPDRLVRQLRQQDIHLNLDLAGLSGGQPGERTYELSPDKLTLPPSLEVVQILPSRIHLSFDVRGQKMAPVKPRVIGSVAPGFHIGSVRSSPEEMAIVGPRQRVQSVDAVTTDAIDVTGVLGTRSYPVTAYVQDPMVRLADPRPAVVTVTVEKTK